MNICNTAFKESRQSLGSRQMMKNLRQEGFNIGRYKVMSMKKDVESYIRYYNGIRLHTTIGDVSPIEFENSKINVCGLG